MDIEQILDEIEQPERTVRICLKGKLVAEHEELERKLQAAQQAAIGRGSKMGDASAVTELAQQVRDVEERMEAASTTFRVRGLGYFEREEWLKANPPRDKGTESFNPITGAPALIAACLVDPVATVDQVKRLIEKAGTGQTDVLFSACLQATNGDGSVPFSVAASVALREPAQKQ